MKSSTKYKEFHKVHITVRNVQLIPNTSSGRGFYAPQNIPKQRTATTASEIIQAIIWEINSKQHNTSSRITVMIENEEHGHFLTSKMIFGRQRFHVKQK